MPDPAPSPRLDPNDPDFLKQVILGLIRHVLTVGAGALVTDGYLSSSDAQTAVGAVMALAVIGWSAWNKYGHSRQIVGLKLALASVPSRGGATTPQPPQA
jgi:hypothetical protein